MLIRSVVLFFLIQNITTLDAFNIIEKPLCSVYTPNSILNRKQDYWPLFIGERARYSTCTGVTWFHQDYLAVLNLFGRKINTYAFLPAQNQFYPLQELDNSQGTELTHSENLVVSPDGSLLALCSDNPNAGIKLYDIDLKSHLINPKPIFTLQTPQLIHNVRFTPDGRYLAAVGEDNDAAVCVYKVLKKSNNVSLELVHQQENHLKELGTKGINFTQSGKLVVVVHSAKARLTPEKSPSGLVLAYTFNTDNGSLGQIVGYTLSGHPGFGYEDVALADNDTVLICSDQNNDMLTIYPFDPVTGKIDSNYRTLFGPETQLDFPHGIGLSQDGNYLAVSNYGDDKCSVYRLESSTTTSTNHSQ